MWTLRQLSMSTAAKLAAGEDPMVEASVVKELGNAFEQDMPRRVQAIVDCAWDDENDLAKLLRALLIASPSRSEEHTSELQSLMRTSYAVFCVKTKNIRPETTQNT